MPDATAPHFLHKEIPACQLKRTLSIASIIGESLEKNSARYTLEDLEDAYSQFELDGSKEMKDYGNRLAVEEGLQEAYNIVVHGPHGIHRLLSYQSIFGDEFELVNKVTDIKKTLSYHKLILLEHSIALKTTSFLRAYELLCDGILTKYCAFEEMLRYLAHEKGPYTISYCDEELWGMQKAEAQELMRCLNLHVEQYANNLDILTAPYSSHYNHPDIIKQFNEERAEFIDDYLEGAERSRDVYVTGLACLPIIAKSRKEVAALLEASSTGCIETFERKYILANDEEALKRAFEERLEVAFGTGSGSEG